MWETRRNCTLGQCSEHEITLPLAVFACIHTHTRSFSFFLHHFWSSHAWKVPGTVPKHQARGAFWAAAVRVLQDMLLPAQGHDGMVRVKPWSLQEK